MKFHIIRNWAFFLSILAILGTSSFARAQQAAAPIRLTLLHTNDIHSHYRPSKSGQGLGGIARIKTLVDRIRAESPYTVFVDGGDWSEGTINYTDGAGAETLQLMDAMGYDVAVVGNHDWLNGPDVLLRAIDKASLRMSLVGANLQPSGYREAEKFRQRILPYVIREIGGVKIAFLGLVTYNLVFDSYFSPIKITEPFDVAQKIASRLKQEKKADVVIAISHNFLSMNQSLLKAAPDVDFVVGAHDHQKTPEPLIVTRSGRPPGWIVEAEYWGHYVGRLDVELAPGAAPKLLAYRMIPVDSSIPEDPVMLDKIASVESNVEKRMGGPVYHDHLGESELELGREGLEPLIGDFVTDAYRQFTGADAAIDKIQFIYSGLHRGVISTADAFDVHAGVYNPNTNKSWSVKVVYLKGQAIRWILNLLSSVMGMSAEGGILSVSGIQASVSAPSGYQNRGKLVGPVGLQRISTPGASIAPHAAVGAKDLFDRGVREVRINGNPLELQKAYRVAVSTGIYESILFANSLIPNAIPLEKMEDTGIEAWRMIADRVRSVTPVGWDDIQVGRIRTTQPDLGLFEDDLQWIPLSTPDSGPALADLEVSVKNYGLSPSVAGNCSIGLFSNANGTNTAPDPAWVPLGALLPLPAMKSDERATFRWKNVLIPQYGGFYPVAARMICRDLEPNTTNDEVIRWFRN